MRFRRLGRTGIKLSAVGLGGWFTFSDSSQDPELLCHMVRAAHDMGVNFFDIADEYGGGEAERAMGRAFRELPRHTLVISSKVFYPMSDDVNDRGLSRKHIMESVHKSLKRIGTEYLDIYFCHRYDPETQLEEVIRAMDDLVHQGKVLYWGTSEWSAPQITEAVGIARQHDLYAPQVEQALYNLLYRDRVEQQVLPAARESGLGIVAFSPLAMGMLTGKYDGGLPQGSRLTHKASLRERWVNDENRRCVQALAPLAEELGITQAQLALAWVLRYPEISSAIVGATSLEQIEANVRAAEVTLPADVLERIDAIVAPAGSA